MGTLKLQQVDEEVLVASERTRQEWVRRRLLLYCGFSIGVAAVEIVGHLVNFAFHGLFWQSVAGNFFPDILPGLVHMVIFGIGFYIAQNRVLNRNEIVRYSFWMILLTGVMSLLIRPVFLAFPLRTLISTLPPIQIAQQPSLFGRVLVIHLVGALFIPWTVREAVRILTALCVLGFLSNMLYVQGSIGQRAIEMLLLPLAGGPGLLYCWFRYSRFRNRFIMEHLVGRYSQIKRELEQARRIHEMLFPGQITEGPFQLRYRYEPTQQIGGDYLYIHHDQQGFLNVVVLDVTGHGISAALTVNRIHGELDRLFGEYAALLPGEVLTALNRYFSVSIARHGIYATAIAVRFTPAGETLDWANAGHPPGFVLRAGGSLETLESNALMLGVLDDPAYLCPTRQMIFERGDRIIVYTDGVIEAKDGREQMFGVEGFQETLLRGRDHAGDDFSEQLLMEVKRYRHGPPQDDTLIVEMFRQE
ncbi:MAG: serine/threonine-protein phosphatase [Sedimentisphaerales bacterium]|nr:serine/threonine-protein phosphatase [Sedimentisphaerales bacterium]